MSGERICSRCGHIIYLSVNGYGECEFCKKLDVERKKADELKRQNDLNEERLKQDRELQRRNHEFEEKQQRLREEELRQNQKFNEQQLLLEEERTKNHQREIEAQEEANRIERERVEAEQRRYEEEKWEREQEKLAQEWENRKKYLDGLPDSEMVIFFEESANARERSYLQQRYRGCISSEDYLALIKDEDKYLAKKKISRFINSHSKGESLDYLLNVEPCWFEQIVEKEHLLDGLMELSPELQNECANQATSKDRQKILRIGNTLKMFKSMSFVDRQIYFREFVHSKCAGRTNRPNGYSDEIGVLYSQMEPLYIEALDPEEKAMYLKNKQDAEKEYYLEQERLKKQYQQEQERKKQLEIERQKKLEELRSEFNEKWNENETIVADCKEISKRRNERLKLYEMAKRKKRILSKIGIVVAVVWVVSVFVVGEAGKGRHSSGFDWYTVILLLEFLFLIASPLAMRIIKKRNLKKMAFYEKENSQDIATFNEKVEMNKRLIARINELQSILKKSGG